MSGKLFSKTGMPKVKGMSKVEGMLWNRAENGGVGFTAINIYRQIHEIWQQVNLATFLGYLQHSTRLNSWSFKC